MMKRKSLVIILIISMILMISTIVNAASYSVGMTLGSSSKLKAGESVVVTVSLSSINAGDGIDTISAELNYDTSVFETLSSSDIVASNGWKLSYAPETKMMTIQKDNKVTAPEAVLTINLKVKATLATSSTKISLSDVWASGGAVANGGTGDIAVGTPSVTINAETPALSDTQNPTTSDSEQNKNTTTSKIKDNTVTTKKTLPKTGIGQEALIAIVVIAIVGIFCFTLYKKIAKEVK